MTTNQIAQTSGSPFSKRAAGWAAFAAVAGCAACCVVPIAVGLGLGGGTASLVARFLTPGAELVVGGLVFAGVLAGVAVTDRIKRRRGAAVGAGCGCASETKASSSYRTPLPSPDEPIVCTANLKDANAIQGGIDAYRAAFTRLVSTDRFPGGCRWVFRAEPGLETELKAIAEQEHECCRFFQFEIQTEGEHVVWVTRADERATAVLDEFYRMPE